MSSILYYVRDIRDRKDVPKPKSITKRTRNKSLLWATHATKLNPHPRREREKKRELRSRIEFPGLFWSKCRRAYVEVERSVSKGVYLRLEGAS